MKYSNPKIPESASSRQRTGATIREFIGLGTGFVVLVVLGSFLFFKGGEFLGPLVPFEWEARLFDESFIENFGPPGDEETQTRLQALADKLSALLELPESMPIAVYYRQSELINAFATFHGHIVIFSGLLERLESENAVAALLAHEIGHIKARHLMQNLSGAIFAGLFYGALIGDTSPLVTPGNHIFQLELASFSRRMEAESDQIALEAQRRLYGHLGGYEELFLVLEREDENKVDAFLIYYDTHPQTADRFQAALAFAKKYEISPNGKLLQWQIKE